MEALEADGSRDRLLGGYRGLMWDGFKMVATAREALRAELKASRTGADAIRDGEASLARMQADRDQG